MCVHRMFPRRGIQGFESLLQKHRSRNHQTSRRNLRRGFSCLLPRRGYENLGLRMQCGCHRTGLRYESLQLSMQVCGSRQRETKRELHLISIIRIEGRSEYLLLPESAFQAGVREELAAAMGVLPPCQLSPPKPGPEDMGTRLPPPRPPKRLISMT